MRKQRRLRCIICEKKVASRYVTEGICDHCRSVKSHLINVYNRKHKNSKYKVCPKCKIAKELESGFGKRGGNEGRWYNSWCLKCRCEHSRHYRKKEGYKEKNAAYMREYRRKKHHLSSSKSKVEIKS